MFCNRINFHLHALPLRLTRQKLTLISIRAKKKCSLCIRVLLKAHCNPALKEALEKHLSVQLNKKVSFSPDPSRRPYGPPQDERNWLNPVYSMAEEFNLSKAKYKHSLDTNPLESMEPKSQFSSIINFNDEPIEQKKLLSLIDIDKYSSAHPEEHASASRRNVSLPLQTDYQIIGQFHKTYILIEQDEALLLVDQHAAHERILYEEFAMRFEQTATIQLLFPQVITLSAAEFSLLESHTAIFTKNNIAIEPIGANQLIDSGHSGAFKRNSVGRLITQTIGWIEENHKLDADLFYKKVNEKLHAQMACKAAVKAGDILTTAQMHQLLRDLETIKIASPALMEGQPAGIYRSMTLKKNLSVNYEFSQADDNIIHLSFHRLHDLQR